MNTNIYFTTLCFSFTPVTLLLIFILCLFVSLAHCFPLEVIIKQIAKPSALPVNLWCIKINVCVCVSKAQFHCGKS